VVVGGGLAGAVAALELRARAADVTLVRAAPGATALTWGPLDVAAGSPLRRGGLPLRDPATGAPLAPAGRASTAACAGGAHPYTILLRGRAPDELVKEAAAALDGWLAPAGLRVLGSLAQTRWLADVHGALRAADLAFSGAGEGALEGAAELALVEVPGLPGFEPRAALRALAAELAAVELEPRPAYLLRIELPPGLRAEAARPARLASRLDADDGRAALRAAFAALGAEGRLLLVPPVLGLADAAGTRACAQEAAGCRVAELVGSPALALAGFRLDAALEAALARAGVESVRGRATGVATRDGRAHAVEVADSEPLPCEAVVLATGRFVGGGLVDRGGVLVEPLLGLPLYDAGGRRVDGLPPHRLVRRDQRAEQPLFAAGVRTDARLRPIAAAGTPRCANLFAAGDLLGGFDPARDRTGLGVALLSGLRAGREAAAC
jgi:glycerol-3-phosphate dehydrogenase subunit B